VILFTGARGSFLAMPEASVLTVENDPVVVESALVAGRFACPECGDRLRRWGFARFRKLRLADGVEVWLRPRRARCGDCGMTQVLLADVALSRRQDGVEVIGSALVDAAAGRGSRWIAERLGLARSTVRGWLVRFGARAALVVEFFCRWAQMLDPVGVVLVPSGGGLVDAVAAVGMATRAGVVVGTAPGPWRVAAVLTRGALLATRVRPWLAAA
jgi:hypothetical protein